MPRIFVTLFSKWHAITTWVACEYTCGFTSLIVHKHSKSYVICLLQHTTHTHKHLIRKSIEFNDCDTYFVFVHILFTNKSHVILQVFKLFFFSVSVPVLQTPIWISIETLILRAEWAFERSCCHHNTIQCYIEYHPQPTTTTKQQVKDNWFYVQWRGWNKQSTHCESMRACVSWCVYSTWNILYLDWRIVLTIS